MAGSVLSGGGASSAGSASNAQQATGGDSSQTAAIASTGMTPEQQKAADDFANYGKYQYKEKNSDRATIDNLEKSGQISHSTASEAREYVDKGVDIGFKDNTPYIKSVPAEKGSGLTKVSDGIYKAEIARNADGSAVSLKDDSGKPISASDVGYYQARTAGQNNRENPQIDMFGGKVPDIVAYSQTRTVTPEMITSDYERPSSMEIYRQTLKASSAIPGVGDVAKTVETVTINPLTNEFSPILPMSAQQVQYRMNEWEMADQSALERANAGIQASKVVLDAALTVGGGYVLGFAGKAASYGLGRLSSSKVGTAVTNMITKPWISNNVMNNAAPVLLKANNMGVKAMNKLPVGLQIGIDSLGKKTLSPQALSSIGVGMLATSAGMDAKMAVFAKQGFDASLKITSKLSNPDSKIRSAFKFYQRSLISTANIVKMADGFKKGSAAIIKAEGVIATKFPHGYKAATAVKNGFSTPGAAIMNGLQLAYIGDAGYRLVTSDNKLKTAAQIALELPAGYWGAKLGIKSFDRLNEYMTTRGRQYVPIQTIGYAEGIPLGKGMTGSTLEASFSLNTPIPRPYKFGRTNYQNQPAPKDAKLPLSGEKFDPKYGYNINETFPGTVWHATPQGERLGNKIIVGDSTSELPGIYTSEVGIGYYLHLEQKSNLKPALLITKSDPSYTPKFATFRVKKTQNIPESARGSQKDMADFLRNSASPLRAYAPNMKEEYEALLPPGASFRKIGNGYFTRINGHKVPIDEYAPDIDVIDEFIKASKMRDNGWDVTTDDIIKGIEKFANLKKTKGNDKFRIYKPSSAYSSYGKASGRQVPLGTTSYPGSKLSRSVSKAASASSRASSAYLGSSKYALSSEGKPASGKSGFSESGLKSAGASLGQSSPSKMASVIYGLGKGPTPFSKSPYKDVDIGLPYKKRKEDLRRRDIDTYKAAQRGRIDHLSLVDPLEFLGRGSMTNRNKADMTLYKGRIYLVDNEITLKKPSGRIKI